MKAKTIKQVISKKMRAWWDSIPDAGVRKIAEQNTIVTGGCIASMLLKEPVNDFDVYFKTFEAAKALADYYIKVFNHGGTTGVTHNLSVVTDDARIKLCTESGFRGETAGDVVTLLNIGQIEDTYEETQDAAEQVEDASYRPVFVSTNAITLANRVQLVFRFYGEPEIIHLYYDFVHCTNYWTSWDTELVLHPAALESLLTKELRYVGSKYPICSIFRLRKFLRRNWTISAGQMLKICFQISELDLTNHAILEDQLTGVDCAYFINLIGLLKETNPEKIDSAYLCEIIERMF